MSLTFLLFLFCGEAKRHSVGKLAGLRVQRKSPNLKRVRRHKNSHTQHSATHLKISERAFHAIFSLILAFCRVLFFPVSDLSQHRPVINLELHLLLNWRWCGGLCWRCSTCVWRWTWQLSIDAGSGFVEIHWKLRSLEISQSYILSTKIIHQFRELSRNHQNLH